MPVGELWLKKGIAKAFEARFVTPLGAFSASFWERFRQKFGAKSCPTFEYGI